MLHHGLIHPAEIVTVRCLIWLLIAQLWIFVRDLPEAADCEIELNGNWLFGPERPVIVENRDPLIGRYKISACFVRHCADELDDCLARRRIVPRGQQFRVDTHASSFPFTAETAACRS